MANIIKPKRSNTAAKVPNTTELTSGELGVNMADRKVYINNGTAVVQVGAGNLNGLGDVAIATPTNGQGLTYNSTTSKWQNSSAGTGTVTSVGITPGTGVTVSGSPVTTSGNIAVGLSTKLTAIENLSGAGFITQNGTGVIAGRTLQAGTGISIAHGNGSSQDPIITNSAPDQTVALTGAGATTISGTYPNFTISSVNTTYSLATSTVPGLVELASDTAQTVAANAVTATASRSYGLQLNAAGQGVINVPWTDTVYSLPAATTTVRGGIELGSDTAQTIAPNAVTATASRSYALQVNAAGQGVVNVPWTDTNSGGTVTSVSGTGTASGLSLSGTVTTSGNLTLSGTVNSLAAGTYAISISGNAATATNVAYSGLTGTVPTWNQNTTGNAATATALQTARTIGGVSFNGTANINLPGVNTAGNQNTSGTAAVATAATVTTSTTSSAFKVPFANTTASTTGNYGLLQDSTATFTYNPSTNTLEVGTVSGALSGNAATATKLQTARTINGVSFDGTADITVSAVLPPGSVVQVVSATYSTQVSTASSTYTDTGLTATITPTSSTSKILVIVSQSNVAKDSNNTGVNIRLLRGASVMSTPSIISAYTNTSASNNVGSVSLNFLDSPATTSATTYKTQLASNMNSATCYVQTNGATSYITLMEIAS